MGEIYIFSPTSELIVAKIPKCVKFWHTIIYVFAKY